MRVFIDSNIFLAVIEGSTGSQAGRQLLNNDDITRCTSLLNLVEIRNVLMKKKQETREFSETLLTWLENQLDVIVYESPALSDIDELHERELLDPMDCFFVLMAEEEDCVFVSLENELQDAGAVGPADI